MNPDLGWFESASRNCLFNPENNIITSPSVVIAKIMIKADLCNLVCLEQFYRFVRPVNPNPARWRVPFVVEVDPHVEGRLVRAA